MGIKGLTNLKPSFPRIGALRKGGEKPAKGGWGKDLDHFRFTSDFPEVARKFYDIYGSTPRSIRIFLPYETTAQNFEVWQKEYSAGGLVHTCDGKYVIRHRVGNEIVDVEGQGVPCPYESGKVARTGRVPGCKAQGRLNVIIPDLQFGNVQVHTSAKNDIIRIDAQLRALESVRRKFGKTLQGVPMILTRVLEKISTPSGEKRARRDKWMVHLSVQEEWGELLLKAVNKQEMEMPQIIATSSPALPSGESIDFETGEVVGAAVFGNPAPERDDFIDYEADEPPFVPDEFDNPVMDAPPGQPTAVRATDSLVMELHTVAEKNTNPANAKQIQYMRSSLSAACDGAKMEKSVMMFVFSLSSGNDATSGQASAIIDWIKTADNNWEASPESKLEAAAIYRQHLINEEQKELL